MRLILRDAVTNLGQAGQVVRVKAGYARNYLIPQGLAYVASDANMRRLEEEQQLFEERSRRDFLEAKRRASQLEGMSLVFDAKAGEEGKLFGSVTNKDIAEAVQAQAVDFDFDRRWILLGEPIKTLGDHTVPVRLHSEVDVEIQVRVQAEEV